MTGPTRAAKRAFTRALEARGYSSAMIADARREGRWWLEARTRCVQRGGRLYDGRVILWNDGAAQLVPNEVAAAGRGELTVETIVSAVSPGTERAQFLRLPNTNVSPSYTPGYSLVGRVIHAGGGVRGLDPGQLVAVIRAPHASVVTVPARDVFAVPEGVSAEAAALVRLGVVAGAGLRSGDFEAGDSVLVLGAGVIGALVARRAAAQGASRVIVAARTRRRANRITAQNGAEFYALDEVELPGSVAQLVIDATGDADAIRAAVAAAAPGGRVVLLGSPRGGATALPVDEIRDKRLTVVGAHVALLPEAEERADALAFLDELSDGTLDIDDLAGERVDPREAAILYRRLARGEVDAAQFAWSLLPEEDRPRRSPVLRPPNLKAQGVETDRRLLSPRRVTTPGAPLELTDPFADATGHLRLALIGCGEIAMRNAQAAVEAPNTELVACFDTRPELALDLAARFSCRVERSLDALLEARDVDAVFLCVPHHLHTPIAVAALEAGKHVIVEKPLANDLRSALEAASAAARAKGTVSVCFPMRYEPRVEAARRLVAAGALGELVGTSLGFLSDKPESYWHGGFTSRSSSDWRTSRAKAGGGILIMNLCHYVDLLRHLTGDEPAKVLALTGAVDRVGGLECTVAATMQYGRGAVGTFFGSTTARGMPGGSELRLWGTEGHIVVEPNGSVFTERALPGIRSGRWHTFGELPAWNSRSVFLSRFASALAEGRDPDVTIEDGLAVQTFIESAYRSAEWDAVELETELPQPVAP